MYTNCNHNHAHSHESWDRNDLVVSPPLPALGTLGVPTRHADVGRLAFNPSSECGTPNPMVWGWLLGGFPPNEGIPIAGWRENPSPSIRYHYFRKPP